VNLPKNRIKRSHISYGFKIGAYGSKIGHFKKEKNFYLKFFLILMVVIFLAIVYTWQRVTLLTLAGEIKRLNTKLSHQQEEYKYLQVEVASLFSVERIGRLAEEMGFVCPSFEQKGTLPEAPDSAVLEKKGILKNMWTKLEGIKRNLLSQDKVEAKEVKHGL
jgi:cell division protein FtsL